MKKILLIWFSVIVLINCTDKEKENDSLTNHIKYFGFAVTDCGLDKLALIDNFVNLVDMCLYNLENIDARLNKNTKGDNSVIIHLQGVFLNNVIDSTSPTGVRYKLLPDYKERFAKWISNNEDLRIDKIAAFTIADEPAWNKMDMNDLAIVAKTVKEKYPTVPILLIESSESIESLTISEDIDWIGFDRYGTLDPNTDADYLAAMEKLKKKISHSYQKIVVVMETQWLSYYSDLGFDQSVLIPMTESYYQYAKNDKNVIAVIGYLLPSDFDETGQKGYFDLDDNVKVKIQEIGFEIASR